MLNVTNKNVRQFCLVAAAALMLTFGAMPTQAIVVTAEPDDYPLLTDIRTAFDGVTLSAVDTSGNITSNPVLTRDSFSAIPGFQVATTGTLVFGQLIDSSLPITTGQVWDEATYGVLRGDFDHLTDFVQIDLVFGDDTVAMLRAFDVMGNLLDEVIGIGDGRGPVPFVRASISRSTPDIAYFLAGGVGAEASFLDNLQFNLIVPEPPAWAMFGTSIVLLLGVSKFRRRQGVLIR